MVAYEKSAGGNKQIAYRVLAGDGKGGEKFASQCKGQLGNGDSRNPVIHNAGFYITYESDASNLCTMCLADEFHSFRRDGDAAGRLYSFAGIRALE